MKARIVPLLAAVVVVTPALADPVLDSTAIDRAFDALDADRSGSIEAAEARADEDLNAVFSAVDGDRDGGVDRAEFDIAHALQVNTG